MSTVSACGLRLSACGRRRVGPPLGSVEEFWEIFPDSILGSSPAWRRIPEEELPEPYRRLLAHKNHMTVTIEAAHRGRPVAIRVLSRHQDDDVYCRRTLLTVEGTEVPVLLGVVRLALDCMPPAVREEILDGAIPLGRILIKNNVFRRVEPFAYAEIRPTPELRDLLGAAGGEPLYGRLAKIECGGCGVIDLLEIAAPER